ncbi:MAG: BACON domain-containing protein [Bacteroidales bacterium]|nr:BACON domain-containing protein [Bacteroidales bacterium]
MKKIFSILAVAAALFSCNKLPEPAISVTPENAELESSATTVALTIYSNRDWTAEADCDWLSISPAEGYALDAAAYATVTVNANTGDAREGKILIKAVDGSKVVEFVVTQGRSKTFIASAQELVAYLEGINAGTIDATELYTIEADLDLAGITLPKVSVFNGQVSGKGHVIKNWTSSQAICDTVAVGSVISEFVLDKSCKLTIPAGVGTIGFVANVNNGVVTDVVNEADVTIEAMSKDYKGSIVGVNNGDVMHCTNKGKIVFSGAPHTDGSAYVGGVAGRVVGPGEMHDCTNEGVISIAFNDATTQSIYAAGVVGAVNSNGKCYACKNTADVKVTLKGSGTNAQVAGIVCYAGGEVGECNNSGNISLFSETSEGAADCGVKGTGVAGIACYMGWSGGTMYKCVNTGAITLRAGFSVGYQTVGSATKYATNVAGVAGHAFKCGIVECSNSGKVTSIISKMDKAPDAGFNTTARQSCAGIVASSWGAIERCNNYGIIEVVWTTEAHNAALAKNFVGQVGGISGGDYHSDQISTSINNCTNEGNINITCDSSQSNNAFGGIVGWPGKENATCTNEIDHCTNTGKIILDGFSKSRLGGISGGAVKLTGCINRGAVTLKGGLATCSVGGINGFGNFFDMTSCENYGDVTSAVKLNGAETSAAGGLGGLVGAIGNTAVKYVGCKSNCKISVPDGSAASLIIGVIGQNKAVTTVLEVGTADAPIKIKGSYNGTALTADNFQSYMRRQDWAQANEKISFNVVYGE